jgi:hypothetical protein
LIIDTLQEFTNAAVGILEIAVFVAVNLLLFQGFHERLARRVGQGSQLQLMATLPTVVLKSPIHIIR